MSFDRELWVLVERFSPVIVLLGLGAPFIGALLGTRAGDRWRRRGFGAALGVGAGLLAMPVLLWLGWCTPPVGRGATPEWWYRATTPIIAALETYRSQDGAYPDSLMALVPRFLDAADLTAVRTPPRGLLSYHHDLAGYTLHFEYNGPGMNSCDYTPQTKRWICRGLF